MDASGETALSLGKEAYVVRICDNLDAVTAPQLIEYFGAMNTECCRDLILDLSEVSFMDSTGVGAIVSVFRSLRGSGVTLATTGATGQPLDLIKLVGLDSVIEVLSEPPAAARVVDLPASRTGEERDESSTMEPD